MTLKTLLSGPLAAAALLFALPLAAQQARRVPVTVVLVERLPQTDAPFVIQRRPDLTPRDVILLRSDATADQLSDAVRSLLTIRQAGGDSASARANMRMRPHLSAGTRSGRRVTPRRALPWVQRVLADVQKAALRDVPGVGRVRAVEIWLPAQQRRGRQSAS
jgi:hypothetical protein